MNNRKKRIQRDETVYKGGSTIGTLGILIQGFISIPILIPVAMMFLVLSAGFLADALAQKDMIRIERKKAAA